MFVRDMKDRNCSTLHEYYVAEDGRTLLARNYDGPGWCPPGGAVTFESLKGNREVTHQGFTFRHSGDTLSDIAFDTKL